MFITWPFLWEDPVANFIEVFRLMSDNPTTLSVLFGGEVYRAGELPRRYMPFMLATTLTEPVWPLFVLGVIAGYYQLFKENRNLSHGLHEGDSANSWRSLRSSLDLSTIRSNIVSLTLILALVSSSSSPMCSCARPAMYDGLRHFLFILPPIFIFTGFAFEFLTDHLALLLATRRIDFLVSFARHHRNHATSSLRVHVLQFICRRNQRSLPPI